MSHIVATVEQIENVENLNIVTLSSQSSRIKMVSLELSEKIVPGRKVKLACKPTSVALAKRARSEETFSKALSYANQIPVRIDSIEEGKLLSSVLVRFGEASLEALILSDALGRMSLKEGDEVTALIKVSDLSILEVLDD